MLYVWNSESRKFASSSSVSQNSANGLPRRTDRHLNRAAYEREAEKWAQAQTPFYLFMVDLNGLKRINDTRGHQAGDVFICNAVSLLKQVAGAPGQLFRFGAMNYYYTSRERRIREALYCFCSRISGRTTVPSVLAFPWAMPRSIRRTERTLHSVLRRADKRMYACKKQTRASEYFSLRRTFDFPLLSSASYRIL